MAWNLRHEGSPTTVKNVGFAQVVEGLRDGVWDLSDEIQGSGETEWTRIEAHPAMADLVEELEAPPRVVYHEATSLDMNALIDVCLVLLIFFIITTSYANMVQKVVPVPTVKADGKSGIVRQVKPDEVRAKMIRLEAYLEKNGKPIIRIENQSADVFDGEGKTLVPQKLREILKPYVMGPDRKKEILLDAREITWETVVQIQDAARSAGIQSIQYVAKKK